MDIGALCKFLKRYGHLDETRKEPRFQAKDFKGFMSTLAARYVMYQDDPFHYQPPKSGRDIYIEDYKRISVPGKDTRPIEERIKDEIKEPSIVADICSGLGRKYILPIAKENKRSFFVMIDNLSARTFYDAHLNDKNPNNRINFHVKVDYTGDVEALARDCLQANGFSNVRYVASSVDELDLRTVIQQPEYAQNNHKKVVIGLKAPRGIGYTIIKKALSWNADTIYLNNSAIERISPDDELFKHLRKFFKAYLKEHETDKLISLIHDPEHETRKDIGRYDYRKPGHEEFATVLKLAFVLPQKALLESHGYLVRLYRNSSQKEHYNSPGFDVIATHNRTH